MRMTPGKCKACGEPILWAYTLKVHDGIESIGVKAWPVDYAPSARGNVLLAYRPALKKILALVNAAPVEGGRMAHHATCLEWGGRGDNE